MSFFFYSFLSCLPTIYLFYQVKYANYIFRKFSCYFFTLVLLFMPFAFVYTPNTHTHYSHFFHDTSVMKWEEKKMKPYTPCQIPFRLHSGPDTWYKFKFSQYKRLFKIIIPVFIIYVLPYIRSNRSCCHSWYKWGCNAACELLTYLDLFWQT